MKRFILTVAILTLAGLTYVYTEVEAVKIGYAIRKNEESKIQFLDRQRELKYNIAKLTSPGALEKKLEEGRIVLESPKAWQTLVIPESVGLAGSAKGSKQNFAVGQDWIKPFLSNPSLLTRFLIGTAQAEANES